jgi:hypothetical protein
MCEFDKRRIFTVLEELSDKSDISIFDALLPVIDEIISKENQQAVEDDREDRVANELVKALDDARKFFGFETCVNLLKDI